MTDRIVSKTATVSGLVGVHRLDRGRQGHRMRYSFCNMRLHDRTSFALFAQVVCFSRRAQEDAIALSSARAHVCVCVCVCVCACAYVAAHVRGALWHRRRELLNQFRARERISASCITNQSLPASPCAAFSSLFATARVDQMPMQAQTRDIWLIRQSL